MFYLIRHGEANYSERGIKIFQGHGENFASLTEKGIQQIEEAARDFRLKNADIIISSPYTRALQSAAILSKELQTNIIVETDLHEWLADKNYKHLASDDIGKHFKDFMDHNGDYPYGEEMPWEDNVSLKHRLIKTLDKYQSLSKVIVVTHGFLIHSIFQKHWLENGEILEYRIN